MQLSSEALADLEQAAMEAAEDADAQLEEASALRVSVGCCAVPGAGYTLALA